MNITKELIIDVSPTEVTLALLEDRKLVELYKDRTGNKYSVGDIYLGRVKKLIPGLNAAFVDVGHEKDAFLHYLDLGPQIRTMNKLIMAAHQGKAVTPLSRVKPEPEIDKTGKISDVLKEGQIIAVQIAKEPISTKGPRLTSEISIPGRNIVLIPFSNKVSISQKIASSEEKIRLKKLLLSIKPKNYGVIVRTVAETQRVASLDQELRELIDQWEGALGKIKGAKAPKLILGEMNRTTALLRDLLNDSFHNIYINDAALFGEIRDYIQTIAPEQRKIVKLYQGRAPIFDQFNVSHQINSHFGRTVAIRKGAYLVIEHTEALHVIDVNSGNRNRSVTNQEDNAFDVNIAVADEIARQLRLRDMGGIVVIDFIDMGDPEHRQKLYEHMRTIMQKDRARHQILPLSKFGLMQITRQRVRPVMDISTVQKCPICKGKGEIPNTVGLLDEVERNIELFVEKTNNRAFVLRMHPFIHAYLTKGWIFSRANRLRRKYGNAAARFEADANYNYLEYHIFDNKGNIFDEYTP